jgi:hypothetical protein
VSQAYTSDNLVAVFSSAFFLLCYAYVKVSWDLPW